MKIHVCLFRQPVRQQHGVQRGRALGDDTYGTGTTGTLLSTLRVRHSTHFVMPSR